MARETKFFDAIHRDSWRATLSMNCNGSIQNAKENSHCFILSAENLLAHCIPVTGSRMGELRPLYARQKGGNSMPIAILYSKFSSTNLQNVMTATLVSGYTGWKLYKRVNISPLFLIFPSSKGL